MKYNIVKLFLKTDDQILDNTSKIRGFIGNKFKEYNLLHNHYGNNYIFTYPKVQYKIVNGKILILGINEGGEILKKISSNLNYLDLDKKYHISEKIIHEKIFDIKPTIDAKHYKFVTPWIGLNTNNYQKFKRINNWRDKKILLNKIIVGNILSLSKGLGIIVNKKLYAKSFLNEENIIYKSVKMNAFKGEFKIHYDLPDYIGIGKGVSHGFGCVKKLIK
ncbi:CRISPR-associated endonuclease Cas6 [uncultured Methanobrevibacter sp.]|uniref:CRISPR-associated endonuclease Cas6 n=1 Tax=uncultured Methanobrevibacter sp. TaxID=253161 RepID=UPI0025D917F6|nr:CRISPR-associated endonuclease Cas6 [uncultured Methanobrevibacter sp.]